MQIIKEYIRENKKILLIILVIGIVLGIISIYMNNKNNKKIYSSDDYVFTKDIYEYNDYSVSELPYINIKGDKIREINNDLINQYYEIVEFKEKMMKYDYYINDNILSLIIKIYYLESPDSFPTLLIYNIDIDNGNILNNREVLSIFGISSSDVDENIRNEIKEYYNYELGQNYIDSSCNFDCYLSTTNSLPIDEYNLYVMDNTLYAYKKISLDKNFYYDSNSGFNLFHFKIIEK